MSCSVCLFLQTSRLTVDDATKSFGLLKAGLVWFKPTFHLVFCFAFTLSFLAPFTHARATQIHHPLVFENHGETGDDASFGSTAAYFLCLRTSVLSGFRVAGILSCV